MPRSSEREHEASAVQWGRSQCVEDEEGRENGDSDELGSV